MELDIDKRYVLTLTQIEISILKSMVTWVLLNGQSQISIQDRKVVEQLQSLLEEV